MQQQKALETDNIRWQTKLLRSVSLTLQDLLYDTPDGMFPELHLFPTPIWKEPIENVGKEDTLSKKNCTNHLSYFQAGRSNFFTDS